MPRRLPKGERILRELHRLEDSKISIVIDKVVDESCQFHEEEGESSEDVREGVRRMILSVVHALWQDRLIRIPFLERPKPRKKS